jgi:hypothetical protein
MRQCNKIVRFGGRIFFGTLHWWEKIVEQVEIGKMGFLNFFNGGTSKVVLG